MLAKNSSTRIRYAACVAGSLTGILSAGEPGMMTREVWNNIPGNPLSAFTGNARYWQAADSVSTFPGAAAPMNAADNFASRVRAYITAPVTGDYTFWIASDDESALYLSTSESKFDRVKIASLTGWVNPQAWDAKPSQKSAVIPLVAGQRYFIEALHKEGGGIDHLAIAWQIPGGTRELIPASALESFTADPNDVDNDDLRDDWEEAHGFILSDNETTHPDQHPLADPDHDGYSNLEESEYGTDPNVRGGVPGSLLLETWYNIGGANVEDLTWSGRYTAAPDRSEFVFATETPVNRGDHFGARMRGYIIAPETGDYVFHLAGDDSCELWLSPSEIQFAKQKIASVDGWTNVRQWTKYSTQTSVSISLVAGEKYYIEALQKEAGGGDHLEIGWQTPGSSSIAVIPGSNLESYAYDANDADGDNMPDDWEALHGLNPAINDAAQDPDQDAIPNHLEWSSNGDPQMKNSIQGGLLQELWWNVPGKTVDDFTSSARYHALPNVRQIVVSSECARNLGDNYGRRMRGYLTAPVTGDYTFWIASDDSSVLLLSDGESKYNRAEIASVTGYVNPVAWDTFLSQKSKSIHLVAGQRYYIEALHKEFIGADHLAIAWQKPGGSRELIPCSALSTYAPTPDDLDDNDLPDSWQIANGIPVDPIRSNPAHGFYGDLDGDGLTNAEEWKAGTRADLVDTDGDGVSDFDEVKLLESSPLTADAAPFEPTITVNGAAFSASGGEWLSDDNSAYQGGTRGWVEYAIDFPSSGIFQVSVKIEPLVLGLSADPLEVVAEIDGVRIGRSSIQLEKGTVETVKLLTPWLKSGVHYCRIFIDNAATSRRIAIQSFEIGEGRGEDTNSNGIPDWMETRVASRNSYEAPAETYTSPVCLEGDARWAEFAQVGGQPVQLAPNDRWFANVPLSPGASNVTASLENGAIVQSREIVWKPVNIFEVGELAIRQGDALRLTAFAGPQATADETVQLSIDGNTFTIQADQPLIHEFSTPGSYQVHVSHTLNGISSNAFLNVNVVAMPEIESPVCVIGDFREVDIPALQNGASIQFDERIEIQGTITYPSGSVKQVVRVGSPDDRFAVARLGGASGPILGTLRYRAMRVRSGTETSLTIQDSSTQEMMRVIMPVVIDGLWPDVEVKIEIFIGGTTFADGSLVHFINPPVDADALGTVFLEFLKAGTSGSICHRVSVWQGSKRISWKQ